MYNTMMNGFKLFDKECVLNGYIRKTLVNYPRKEYILKDKIQSLLLETKELIINYKINWSNNRISEKCLKDILIKLSLVDHLIYNSYKEKYISQKQFIYIGKSIEEIVKITYGVLNVCKY